MKIKKTSSNDQKILTQITPQGTEEETEEDLEDLLEDLDDDSLTGDIPTYVPIGDVSVDQWPRSRPGETFQKVSSGEWPRRTFPLNPNQQNIHGVLLRSNAAQGSYEK